MQIYSKLNKFNAFYFLQLYLLGFLWRSYCIVAQQSARHQATYHAVRSTISKEISRAEHEYMPCFNK